MTLESSRTMGGIGALLIVIGALPFLGAYTSILSLIGLILVLIALNGLANIYNERGIFNNALYGILAGIVGIVVSAAILIFAGVGFFTALGIDITTLINDPTAFSRIDWTRFTMFADILPYLAIALAGLVVLFVFFVLSAFFVRRSFNLTAAKSGVGMFNTAGLLLLIGAVLTIIVIGLLLMFIAAILLIVAFFQIRSQPAGTGALPPPPTPPQQTA